MKVPILPVSVPEKTTIPRVVHQIWAGGAVPEWVQSLWARWDEFASLHQFQMRRWTDGDIALTLSGRLGAYYDLPPVQVADLLRIELLAVSGGVYMDSDTVPLRPLDLFFGYRTGWIAHGQAWTKDGEPTVSNAMIGMPAQTQFMSQLFEHAANALERGLKRTFDIAGPSAYRRILTDEMKIQIASMTSFPAFKLKQKQAEERLGRPLTTMELQIMYPGAYVVHLSAESWVEGKLEKRGLRG